MPKIWLAPLHGITLYHFRNCLLRHSGGINAAIAPFLPVCPAEKLNVRKWPDITPENNKNIELVPQLMGTVPAFFEDTMKAIHDAYGYTRFNWNLGCPMAPIVRKKRGCGLMPFPDEVEAVVKAATRLPFQFSVKMRLGMHSEDEGIEIMHRLNDYPLEFVVIHPRLGDQHYEGVPDLDALERLLAVCKHTVIYSGDINTVADYQKLSNRFPQINQWMLGRGLLRNPFLAEQIENQNNNIYHNDNQLVVKFNDFYDDLMQTLLSFRSEAGTLAMLKELWHYFAVFFHLTEEQLQSLLRSQSLAEFNEKQKTVICQGLNMVDRFK